MKRLTLTALTALISAVSTLTISAATLVVTNTNDDGPGSLRDAIVQSNSNAQPDTIEFDPAVFSSAQTIVLVSEIQFARDGANTGREVTVNGPGSGLLTISGNNATRAFYMPLLTEVTLRGMTIRDCNGVGTSSGSGGAIYSFISHLTLNDVVVRNNSVANNGGGIFVEGGSAGTLTISDSVFTENSSGNQGGGIAETGGASTVKSIVNTTISNNTARTSAGGAHFSGGRTTIANCRISGNKSDTQTGGLHLSSTIALVTDTAVSNNFAGDIGENRAGAYGGIFASGAEMTFRRITVTGNAIWDRNDTNAEGGGIELQNGSVRITIIDSLIAGNHGGEKAVGFTCERPHTTSTSSTRPSRTTPPGVAEGSGIRAGT